MRGIRRLAVKGIYQVGGHYVTTYYFNGLK